MNKPILILSTLLACALLTSCADNTKVKQEVQTSLNKQTEMKNYTFSGSADIDFGNLIPQTKGGNAESSNIVNSLTGILQNSKLTWQGVANTDPVQLEADIKATPAALGTTFDLPIILKDNKLYMNIPLLSKPDEYFSVNLAADGSGAGQKNPLTPDSLKNVTQVTYQISSMVVTDLDPTWFKQSPKPTSLKDGKQGNVITVDITDQNKTQFTQILQANFPAMVDKIAQSGIITGAQAAQLKQLNVSTLQVETPSSISLTTDETGFIRSQDIQLNFSINDASGTAVKHHLILNQSFDEINQNPKFTKEIPQKTKSLADVLKMLQPQK